MKRFYLIIATVLFCELFVVMALLHGQQQQSGYLATPSTTTSILGQAQIAMTNASCDVVTPGSNCTVSGLATSYLAAYQQAYYLTGTLSGPQTLTIPLQPGASHDLLNCTGQIITVGGLSGATVAVPSDCLHWLTVKSIDGANYYGTAASAAALPTATSAGQIITSSAAGTTYTVQSNIFYQKSGDTITSIEAECSSRCLYIVTQSQTITMVADHTLSSNVNLQFIGNGGWITNGIGFTLTINPVSASSTQNIFSGTASIKFAAFVNVLYAAWFGMSTGNSTNATNLQTAVNAVGTNGGNIYVGAGTFPMGTGTVTVVTNYTSIYGMGRELTSLTQSSGTADILQFVGAGPQNLLFGSNMGKMTVKSSSRPPNTSTKNCVLENYVSYYTMEYITAADCINDFNFHSAGINGVHNWLFSSWALAGYDNTYTQLVGRLADSADGHGESSLTFYNSGTFGGSAYSGSANTIDLFITGTAIFDVDSINDGSTNVAYGVKINATGGTGSTQGDIKISHYTTDGCTQAGLYVSGVTAVGSLITVGGNSYFYCGTNKSVDIESSAGIDVSNFIANRPVVVNNSNNITMSNAQLAASGELDVTSSPQSSFTNFSFLSGLSGSPINQFVNLVTTTGDNFTNFSLGGSAGNTNGYALVGIKADATSAANNVTSPTCKTATVTTCYSGITPFSMVGQGDGLIRNDVNGGVTQFSVVNGYANSLAGTQALFHTLESNSGNEFYMGSSGTNNYINAGTGPALQILYHGTTACGTFGPTTVFFLAACPIDSTSVFAGLGTTANSPVLGSASKTISSATGVTYDSSGTNGANFFGWKYSGPSSPVPSACGSIISIQFMCSLNSFYNGSNWTRYVTGAAVQMRASSSGGHGRFTVAGADSGSGTLAGADSTDIFLDCASGGTGCAFQYGWKVGTGAQVTDNQGTGAKVQHSTGAVTSGHLASFDAAGNAIDSGDVPANLSTATIAVGAGAGTSATATCSVSTCTGQRGRVSVVAGTGPAAGTNATATFGTAFASAPVCIVTQNGGAAAYNAGWSSTTTVLTITSGIAISGTVEFDYHCML